jgi:hypothetical protein
MGAEEWPIRTSFKNLDTHVTLRIFEQVPLLLWLPPSPLSSWGSVRIGRGCRLVGWTFHRPSELLRFFSDDLQFGSDVVGLLSQLIKAANV